MFSSRYSTVAAKVLAVTSLFFSNPPTAADAAFHNAKLDQLAANGQYFLLVAHSQGNLFANQAYDHILPTVGASGVQVVHIGPASTILHGNYVLSDNDLVISKLLGLVGAVYHWNYALPFNPEDATGHGLTETYLNTSLVGTFQGSYMKPFQVVTLLISTAIDNLGTPVAPSCTPPALLPMCSALTTPFTLAQYSQITTGMTLDQVNSIMGCVGISGGWPNLQPVPYYWSQLIQSQVVIMSFYNGVFDPSNGSVKSESGLQ